MYPQIASLCSAVFAASPGNVTHYAQYRDSIPPTAVTVSLSDKNHKNLNILIGNLGFNSVKKQEESFLNVMCIQNLLTITWCVGRTLS